MSTPEDALPGAPTEDDALSQMVALLRVTSETLRYMADFGAPAAREPTLGAIASIETAIVRLREAAKATRHVAHQAPEARNQPPCH